MTCLITAAIQPLQLRSISVTARSKQSLQRAGMRVLTLLRVSNVTIASISALGEVLAFLHRFEPVEVAARGIFVAVAFAHGGLWCLKRILDALLEFSCVICVG